MAFLIGVLLGVAFVCSLIYLIATGIISIILLITGRKIQQKSPKRKSGTFLKCLGIALGIVLIVFPIILTNLV